MHIIRRLLFGLSLFVSPLFGHAQGVVYDMVKDGVNLNTSSTTVIDNAEVAEYTLTATNTGTDEFTYLTTITDTLPDGMCFEIGSLTGNMSTYFPNSADFLNFAVEYSDDGGATFSHTPFVTHGTNLDCTITHFRVFWGEIPFYRQSQNYRETNSYLSFTDPFAGDYDGTANDDSYLVLESNPEYGPEQDMFTPTGSTNAPLPGAAPLPPVAPTAPGVAFPGIPPGPTPWVPLNLPPLSNAYPICNGTLGSINVTQEECEALMDIYTSLGSPASWTNWGTSTDLSTWAGVTVALNHVTSLIRPGDQLGGTIPTSIGHLNYALVVDLSDQALTGSIPLQIGGLGFTQELYLQDNNLSGSIPAGVRGWTSMTHINLSNNNLTGGLPVELGSSLGLQYLYLSNNDLSGVMPDSFGRFFALRELHLDGNNISSITPYVYHWVFIEEFYLDGDLNEIPVEVGSLTTLRELRLSAALEAALDPIPAQLGALTNLEVLHITNYRAQGPLPASLGNLTLLQDLDLSGNQFNSPLPPEWANMSSLQTMNIKNSVLTGGLPVEFAHLSNLVSMDLSQNMLEGQLPPEWGGMASIMNMRLNNNGLSCWIPQEWYNLPNHSPTPTQYYAFGYNRLVVPEALNGNINFYVFYYDHDGAAVATQLQPFLADGCFVTSYNYSPSGSYETEIDVSHYGLPPIWDELQVDLDIPNDHLQQAAISTQYSFYDDSLINNPSGANLLFGPVTFGGASGGGTIDISSIPSTYDKLYLHIDFATADVDISPFLDELNVTFDLEPYEIKFRSEVNPAGVTPRNTLGTIPATIENDATISTTYTSDPPDTDTHIFTYGGGPVTADFVLTKTPSVTTAGFGDIYNYAVSIENTGTIALSGIIAQDVLPSSLDYVSGDPGVFNSGSTVNFNFGTLAVGATATLNFTVEVNSDVIGQTDICNEVLAISNETGGVSNIKTTGQICIDVHSYVVNKFATPTQGTLLQVSDVYEYSFTVENTGQTDLDTVVVTDLLSSDIVFVSNLGDSDISVSGPAGSELVTIQVPTLNAGQSVTKTFEVQVVTLPTNINVEVCNEPNASIAFVAGTTQTVFGELGPEICHPVDPGAPSFEVVKTTFTQGDLLLGDPVSYEIVVTNTGTTDITNVTVDDVFPFELSFISPTVAYPNATYTQAGNTVTFDFGGLLVGETKNVVFDAEYVSEGFFCNEASNALAVYNTTPITGTVTSQPVCHEQLQVIVSNDLQGVGYLGQYGNYSVTVINRDPVNDLTNVYVDVAVEPQLRLSPIVDPTITQLPGRVLRFDFGTLAAGTTQSKTYEVDIDPTTPTGTDIIETGDGFATEIVGKVLSNQSVITSSNSQPTGSSGPTNTSTSGPGVSLTNPNQPWQSAAPYCSFDYCEDCFTQGAWIVKQVSSAYDEIPVFKDKDVFYAEGVEPQFRVRMGIEFEDYLRDPLTQLFPVGDVEIHLYNELVDGNGDLNVNDPELDTVTSSRWKYENGRYVYRLSDKELSELRTTGTWSLPTRFQYTVDTYLGPIDDIASITDTSFAVAKFDMDGQSKVSLIGIDTFESKDACQNLNYVLDKYEQELQAQLDVTVVRSFVETADGVALAVNSSVPGDKLFGTTFQAAEIDTLYVNDQVYDQYSLPYGDKIRSNFVSQRDDIAEQNVYIDQLARNTIPDVLFGYNVDAVIGSENIYFYYGSEPFELGDRVAYNWSDPITVIVPDADLIIADDVVFATGFVSVIVQRGDMYINPDVEFLEGLYVFQGQDDTGYIYSGFGPGELEISHRQLTIDGIVNGGDPQHLFQNRVFIGGDNVDSINALQPSFRFIGGLDLIQNTPQIVQEFLGLDELFQQDSFYR